MDNTKNKLKKKTNFVHWNRNWSVIRRHAPIVIKPIIAGLLCSFIWWLLFYRLELSFDEKSENVMLFIVLAFSIFMYAIIAGYAINAVLTEYKEISKAVVRNDMDTFLLYRDEQLPILIHVFLGTISLYIIIFTMLFPFNDVKLGASAVFVVSSLVVMAYVIVSELDDYQKSIWFKEKIPPEWYEVDINEHFNKKAEKII